MQKVRCYFSVLENPGKLDIVILWLKIRKVTLIIRKTKLNPNKYWQRSPRRQVGEQNSQVEHVWYLVGCQMQKKI